MSFVLVKTCTLSLGVKKNPLLLNSFQSIEWDPGSTHHLPRTVSSVQISILLRHSDSFCTEQSVYTSKKLHVGLTHGEKSRGPNFFRNTLAGSENVETSSDNSTTYVIRLYSQSTGILSVCV